MDIVIIPTYNRPEYLRLCLDYLSKAAGIVDKNIRIYVDRGRSLIREFYEVTADFKHLNLTVSFRPEHNYMGNSMNVLEAYKEAYHSDAKLVYLIEDDVLVRPDFFTWHEAVQSCGDFFCSIGYRCIRNSEAQTLSDSTAYFTSARDYASIGVCWRREKLELVVKHATDEYYRDLSGYIARHFPDNRFADSFSEQDGLIMRVMGECHGIVCWVYRPRCYHVGVISYNRPRGPKLSYEEIKEMIHDIDKIKKADRDFGDIEIVPVEPTPPWDVAHLHCVQRFE